MQGCGHGDQAPAHILQRADVKSPGYFSFLQVSELIWALDTAVKGNQLFPSNLQNHFSTGNNINRVTSFRAFSCRRAAAQAVNYNMFPG